MLISLNLGCGFNKEDGYINIDNRSEVDPDLICDVTEGLPFEDSSVDKVQAVNFLEHILIGKTIFVIEEIYRVLKDKGIFYHLTPSTDGRGAFQDPTHVSFWNVNSWLYYTNDLYRNLYGIKAKFSGTNQDIMTNEDMRIIHTRGIMRAVKGAN